MTAKELIADLSIYPDDFEVYICDSEYGCSPVAWSELSDSNHTEIILTESVPRRTAVEQDKYERDQMKLRDQEHAQQKARAKAVKDYRDQHPFSINIDVADIKLRRKP